MLSGSNSVLITCVVVYLLASIAIGLYAARRVKSSTDYMVAGRSLPIYIVTATVFATWFGSETVLGTTAVFIEEGFWGIVADPFGASLCLILVGVFFAVPLYKMNLRTIGDYYRQRYGVGVEKTISIIIMMSYLGWVAAQMAALGVVFNVITHGAISQEWGTVIGAVIVIAYTVYGGMWSVALTDFFQMMLIMIGLVFIAWLITAKVDGGAAAVLSHASAQDKFNLLPEPNWPAFLAFIGMLMTMGLGSIPQQDVFQRVMSAKSANIARNAAIIGGVLYLLFAMIPLYIGYTAFLIDPDLVNRQLAADGDAQLVLPTLILNHVPLFAQVLFFGALLSAIMSTASGTLLAPSVLLSENIIKKFLPHRTDQQFLWSIRAVVLLFGVCVTAYSLSSDLSIFEMVENAYQIPLVGAFVPLAFGLYWKKANRNGAWLAILGGLGVWLPLFILEAEYAMFGGGTGWAWLGLPEMAGLYLPQLLGFSASVLGMVIGSLCLPKPRPQPMAVVEPLT
ncbi:MAG: sodium:solute symporter family protein [Pseudomonadota bacterium]|nr:sodium:solute symporter family protein [Pseudomonadota bacterium]